jgi:two-component system, OmpR family, phosphate regulon response regulator PhoB
MNVAVIADDEVNQLELISHHLAKNGFRTLTATNGEDAFELIFDNKPDIVILDWMMPKSSGISVCRKIRSTPEIKDLPIIILSARGEDIDASHGLSSGADDYIIKPFSPIELIARINSLIRRSNLKSKLSFQEFYDIFIDHNKRIVRAGDVILKVGKIEYNILSLLMTRPEHVFSRDQIIEKVWNNESYIDDRTVDVHVSRLRKTLKSNYKGICKISTIYGFGYSIRKD